MLWTLLPGSISPAFWLGLAFQAPSLMSVVICLLCLWSQAGRMPGWVVLMAGPSAQALTTGRASGVVLGWVLLIDTLALWPVSVYAWGFSAAAVALVALLATLFWGGYGASSAQQMAPDWRVSMLPCGVLILFVVSRWPTGNVWDALLDPWLWMFLQLGWCASVVRRWRAARSGSAAIPA